MKKLLKEKKGITLIALVVTIIVLIVLATVSISLVLGDNGIVTKAKSAKENMEIAKIEEEVALNEAVAFMENMGETSTPTYPSTDPTIFLYDINSEDPQTITITGIKSDYESQYYNDCYDPNDINGFGEDRVGDESVIDVLVIPAEIDGYTVTGITAQEWGSFNLVKKVILPNTIETMENTFISSINALEEIVLSENLKVIGKLTFNNCNRLKNITIPNGVTTIDMGAFDGCSALETITIPTSLTTINSGAFYYCPALTTVNYRGTQEQWNTINIGTYNNYLTNATLVTNYTGQ